MKCTLTKIVLFTSLQLGLISGSFAQNQVLGTGQIGSVNVQKGQQYLGTDNNGKSCSLSILDINESGYIQAKVNYASKAHWLSKQKYEANTFFGENWTSTFGGFTSYGTRVTMAVNANGDPESYDFFQQFRNLILNKDPVEATCSDLKLQ